MARLKVGDIVIDGGSVSFDGQPSESKSSPTVQTLSSSAASGDKLRGVPALPLRVGRLVRVGVLFLTLGLATLLFGGLRNYLGGTLESFSLTYLLLGIPLCSLGTGLIGLGVMKRIGSGPPAPRAFSLVAPEVLEARITRLKPLLQEDSPANTLERLLTRSGLTEQALVETLYIMKERALVEEELNFDTGEWYYRLAYTVDTSATSKRYLTLEEQIKLNNGRK